jgi:hypothetical protein
MRRWTGMSETLNSPKLQSALVGWGAVCLFGVGLGVKLAFEHPFGTDAWQGSVGLIALCVLGWFALAAIVWFEQREVTFLSGAMVVRRWSDVLLGRPGQRITLEGPLRARIFVGGTGYSAAKLEGASGTVKFPMSFWPRSEAGRLPEILERHGMKVEVGGSVFDE